MLLRKGFQCLQPENYLASSAPLAYFDAHKLTLEKSFSSAGSKSSYKGACKAKSLELRCEERNDIQPKL